MSVALARNEATAHKRLVRQFENVADVGPALGAIAEPSTRFRSSVALSVISTAWTTRPTPACKMAMAPYMIA
jgi:hypothetical protein